MSGKYPNLTEEAMSIPPITDKPEGLKTDEIISLLKRARKMYISCKANHSQETGLWGQQCIVLRKLLDIKSETDLKRKRVKLESLREATNHKDMITGYII